MYRNQLKNVSDVFTDSYARQGIRHPLKTRKNSPAGRKNPPLLHYIANFAKSAASKSHFSIAPKIRVTSFIYLLYLHNEKMRIT